MTGMTDDDLQTIEQHAHERPLLTFEGTIVDTETRRRVRLAFGERLVLLAEVKRLRSVVNECLTDLAQSVLETGGLPPEQFPLDHARATLAIIAKRLQPNNTVS